MTMRKLILIVLVGLLITAAALRWPRLEPDMVTVVRCEATRDSMLAEFRMPVPFEGILKHELSEEPRFLRPQTDAGIFVGSAKTIQKNLQRVIAAKYDYLRGEYYIRLTFRRETKLFVEANGEHFEYTIWTAPGAGAGNWSNSGQDTRYGQWVGVYLGRWDTAPGQEEVLSFGAGEPRDSRK